MGTTASKLMKGPKPTKSGINAKVDYVREELAGTGITREEAIQKLIKKFPGTKPTYAKSIVYSRCAGLDFKPVRKRGAFVLEEEPKPSKKSTKKAAPPPKKKTAPVGEAPVPPKSKKKLSTKKKKKKKKEHLRPVSSSPDSEGPVVFDP